MPRTSSPKPHGSVLIQNRILSKKALAVVALIALFQVAAATDVGTLVQFRKRTEIEVSNSSVTTVSLTRKPDTAPIITAEFPGTDWQTATPQEAGMDPVKFATAMATLSSPAVVIRNGRIVGQKGDIARTGLIWSASKSIMALIFARLVQQGQRANYDVIVPGSNVPTNPPASFRQFLAMTSDYKLNPHSPGNHYAYNNGAVHFYGTHVKELFLCGSN